MFLRKLLAAAFVSWALLCWTSGALADVLVDNVNGYSLDAQGRVVRFAAIWIGDDGKVQQLIQRGERKPDRTRYRFDGRGRTVLPGLIDAHGHVMELGFGALELDLSDTHSLAEAQAKIAAYAAANPRPRWVVGRGWNQESWHLGHFPTAADIDAVVGDRPVWLERVDGHAGGANGMAMREAKVDARTPS